MSDRPFIHEEFLLENEQARQLYHGYAAGMPIIDYHCHLSPSEVASDKTWENLAQVWLYGDHYKWRAMRTNGVPEEYCTGQASDHEKYLKFAETMPYLVRNPLYSWTQLELVRYFGVTDLLGPDTAEAIWEVGLEKLAQPEFSARGLMKQSNVVLVCTTDDPVDSLEYHRAVAADASFAVQVLPTWRPDRGMAVDSATAFNAWVDRLAAAADADVKDWDSYLDALRKRHRFFHDMGCRLSDHGLETIYAADYSEAEIRAAFDRVRGGEELSAEQALQLKSALLVEFGIMDHDVGWTQQFHLGAMRNNNSRLFAQLGPDTGFDSVHDLPVARALSRLLDRLDSSDRLARTILYNLNPCDNAVLVSMLGNFQDGRIPGKLQHGSGWWFMDQKDGMQHQIEMLSQLGLLSRFVGMLTDSRSFLSYPRHEFFRRILCNMLGKDMALGVIPDDMELVGRMVRDISYSNAAAYFGFDL